MTRGKVVRSDHEKLPVLTASQLLTSEAKEHVEKCKISIEGSWETQKKNQPDDREKKIGEKPCGNCGVM